VTVDPASLKGPPPPVPLPAEKPGWMRYEEEEEPLARLLENGWVRLLLVAALVLAAVFGIAKLIDDQRPPGYVQEPARP
jgi:hypothetical protein